MRAISCTQCGARIENVSERSIIVDCEYCGARMIMDARRSVEPPPSTVQAPDLSFELDEPTTTTFNPFPLIFGVLVLIPIFIVIQAFLNQAPKPRADEIYLAPTVAPAPPVYSWKPAVTTPEKPVPVVNYQPRVSWDGPNDMEHFEDPEVDISTVADLTTEEVKKTVFKNRTVKLRVVINTEGEINQVEAISGHPLLIDAATQSAKRSIFRSRTKPTTRVLTYTFRVLED